MTDPNTFQEMTPCEGCPCRSDDQEWGASCNLGYDCDLYWTPEGDLVYAAPDCQLVHVSAVGNYFERPKPIAARVARTDKPPKGTTIDKELVTFSMKLWQGVK